MASLLVYKKTMLTVPGRLGTGTRDPITTPDVGDGMSNKATAVGKLNVSEGTVKVHVK